MRGAALAERLVDIRPALRVLFVSGYTENASIHNGLLEADVSYLAKPFTTDALRRAVRAVVGGGRWREAWRDTEEPDG